MTLKTKVSILVVVAGVAYSVGRYFQPAEVITKTEVKEKIVEVEVEKIKTEYRTIVRYITKKDGTTIKEEIKEEIKDKEEVVRKEKDKEKKKDKKVINFKPQWRVQAQANLRPLDNAPQYKIGVERRILGPFFAGVYSSTDFKEYGVMISMEF